MKRLILILISLLFFGFDVGPRKFQAVDPGDIIEVYVSEEAPEDLGELKNKRLGNKLYVLSVDNDNRLLKVIITKEPKEGEQKDSVAVNYINLQFNPDSSPTVPQYFTLETGNEFKIREYIWYVLPIIVLIILVLAYRFFNPWIRLKIKKRKEKNELREMVLNAQAREDYEKIYKVRKQLKAVFSLSTKEISDFEKVMNSYQYRKDWNGDELDTVVKSVNKLKEAVRI